jgi:hypothetical protein
VRALANALLVVAALGTSLFLAWESLSAAAFAYPVLYDWAGIDENVAVYGPRNRYKRAFETTARSERIRLFADLARAVNHGVEGLAQIRYHDPQGRALDTLLRPAEIVHLRDVAGLIGALKRGAYLGIALFLVIALAHWWWRIPPPKAGHAFLTLALLFAAVGAAIYLYGPERLFYQWHTWVFPQDHQWFFYYEESLMTTLMKAPDIFAYMAALLLAAALGIFTLLLGALRWLVGRDTREP